MTHCYVVVRSDACLRSARVLVQAAINIDDALNFILLFLSYSIFSTHTYMRIREYVSECILLLNHTQYCNIYASSKMNT